jgi:hypothetical protein
MGVIMSCTVVNEESSSSSRTAVMDHDQ